MRRLTGILLAAGLIFLGVSSRDVSAQTFPEKFNIPKRFEGYRKIKPSLSRESLPKGFLYYFSYDINNDGKIDVVEIYPFEISTIDGYPVNFPSGYLFDLGGTGNFENSILLLDKKTDGINGNEKFVYSRTEI